MGAFDGKQATPTYRQISAERTIATGSMGATESTAQILVHLDGGRLRSVFEQIREPGHHSRSQARRVSPYLHPARWTADNCIVQATSVFLSEPETGKAIEESFVPAALESRPIKTPLKTAVAGKGLESVQAAIDMSKAGVSGTKVLLVA